MALKLYTMLKSLVELFKTQGLKPPKPRVSDAASLGNDIKTVIFTISLGASQVALIVKNSPANAGNIEMEVWTLVWEDRLEEKNGNPLQYSCLEDPRTEEPGRLQSKGLHKVRQLKRLTCMHTPLFHMLLMLRSRDHILGISVLKLLKVSTFSSISHLSLSLMWICVIRCYIMPQLRHTSFSLYSPKYRLCTMLRVQVVYLGDT